MNLHGVKPGHSVKVTNLDRVDPMLQKRLNAFGMRAGCRVCMKQKGLFSGACVVECEGQQIGLRKKDLLNIEVRAV